MIARKVSIDFEWVQHPLLFSKRMLNLYLNQSFSARDKKLLASLLKEARKVGVINYSQIMHYFPGKDMQLGISTSKKLFRKNSWMKKCTVVISSQ